MFDRIEGDKNQTRASSPRCKPRDPGEKMCRTKNLDGRLWRSSRWCVGRGEIPAEAGGEIGRSEGALKWRSRKRSGCSSFNVQDLRKLYQIVQWEFSHLA